MPRIFRPGGCCKTPGFAGCLRKTGACYAAETIRSMGSRPEELTVQEARPALDERSLGFGATSRRRCNLFASVEEPSQAQSKKPV
jgi:hypothetical protein